jgi:hypothetical protein
MGLSFAFVEVCCVLFLSSCNKILIMPRGTRAVNLKEKRIKRPLFIVRVAHKPSPKPELPNAGKGHLAGQD